MKHVKQVLCVAVAAFMGFVCLAQADAKEEAKARRKDRRAQIEQMIQKGAAKEGDQGYLVAKADIGADKETVMKAENTDRKIGYEAIAKKTGMSLADVQKQAAAAIRRRRASKK